MLDLFKAVKIYDRPQDLHSGGQSYVMFDVLKVLKDGYTRKIVVDYLVDACYPRPTILDTRNTASNKCILGIEFGGAILASMVATKMNCPLGIFRKDKTLYMPNRCEYSGVVIIDDVITTGASIRDAEFALSMIDSSIVPEVVCVVDRREIDVGKE